MAFFCYNKDGDFMKVLIVEDNDLILKGLTYLFNSENFNIISASKYIDALNIINDKYDVAILDVSLPDGNGFDLCKKIKDIKNIPVIFLTAKDQEDDIVNGLNIADEYIVKPFRNKELIMRVNKLLKRNNNSCIIKIKDFEFNLNDNVVKKNNESITLTALEYKILNLLLLNINNVVKMNTLLDFIYDETGNYVNDNTLRVYIKRIREKLNDDIIVTVKGLGYKINENI